MSFNQIPLVLTSSKLIESQPESGLIKKRKMSESSEASNTNSQYDKNMLNDKFLQLSLDNQAKFQPLEDDTVKIEEDVHTQMLNLPQPAKQNKGYSNEAPMSTPAKNNNLFESLIKMSQDDIPGISKYLGLDLNAKVAAWEKVIGNSGPKEKFKMGSVVTSFLNSPYTFPFLKPDFFVSPQTVLSDSQGSCSTQSGSGSVLSKFGTKKNMVGHLTQEQRQEKVNKYFEKKKKRQEVPTVRYQKRKDLADQRERCQGKFVKTTKMFNHSDFIRKQKENECEKMSVEVVLKNNSDLGSNNLTLSSTSLGKRANNSDLFDDDISASTES